MQPSGTLESLVARLFLLKGVFVASSALSFVTEPLSASTTEVVKGQTVSLAVERI